MQGKLNSSPEAPRSSSSYRPEIDGLRAFAVIAVILNHFNETLLPSGYLGVDIFFVISGYVITSSLSGRKSKGFKDFILQFYTRRIKRLVPALALYVILTSLIFAQIIPDSRDMLNLGISSLFGISNIVLYRSRTDYFAGSADLNPFTHTWSLGVEEQFYFIFPILIWFSGFSRNKHNSEKNLFLCVGALSFASLVSFIYLYQTNQPAAYFLMPSRFWEMSAGCLIFLVYKKFENFKNLIEQFPSFLLVALITGIMLLPHYTAIPATIIVVSLTCLLMASLVKGTNGYQFFSNHIVVYIGLISYSLYLWHWGVLCLSRWTVGINLWTAPFQLALMILISIASYKWIETPLRLRTSIEVISPIVSGLTVTASSAFSLLLIREAPNILSSLSNNKGNEVQQLSKQSCEIAFIKSPNWIDGTKLSKNCGESSFEGRPTVYALGDSHSHQYYPSLAKYLSFQRLNYVFAWGASCIFPAAVIVNNEKVCFERQHAIEQSLLKVIKRGDIVFVANAAGLRFSPIISGTTYQDGSNKYIDRKVAVTLFSRKLNSLSEQVVLKGAKFLFYQDTPFFPGIDSGELCNTRWYRPKWALSSKCYLDAAEYTKFYDNYFSWRQDWQDEHNKVVWMPYKYLNLCSNSQCNASQYRDSNHLTPFYANMHFYSFVKNNPSFFKVSY